VREEREEKVEVEGENEEDFFFLEKKKKNQQIHFFFCLFFFCQRRIPSSLSNSRVISRCDLARQRRRQQSPGPAGAALPLSQRRCITRRRRLGHQLQGLAAGACRASLP
jgi:hypothetical protein